MSEAIVSTDLRPTRGGRGARSDAARAVALIWRFTKGQQRTFGRALTLLILEAAAAVFEAYPLAYLIDFLKGDRPGVHLSWLGSERTTTVALLTLGVLYLAAVNNASDSLAEIYLARGGRTLGYQLRVTLFAHLQRLSLAFHDRRRTGDVITRVTGDVKALEEFIIMSLSDFAGSVLLLAGVLVFLAFNSWQVTLVALAIIPILAGVSNYFSKRIKAAARKQRAREGDLASATQEMLTSIRVVQAFGRAPHDQKRFAAQSGEAMDAALEAARLDACFSWVVGVIEAVSIAGVIWIGLWLVDSRAITVGTLILFVILIGRMFKPTRRIIKEWNTIAKVYASVERIADLLEREVTVRDEPGAVPALPLRGRVEFRNVSFAYPSEPEGLESPEVEPRKALNDVSFAIEPGEVVALAGPSGAGKTTLAQLLPRFYDPQDGRVLLDGHDVRSFTLDSVRAQISVVPQETVLVSGSVAENIAYGKTAATREQIAAAALQANAHEFIEQMPDGYDTDLSERAANLSGGQRQRIAIARAFIRNTPILILDEPTTGLDPESKSAVLLALRTLMKGKTTLLISHDAELIRAADRIVLIREGELVEEAGSAAGHRRPRRRLSRESVRLPSRDGLDLRQSIELKRELPELDVALDGVAMRDRLQEELVGANGKGWSIERCTPGKAIYVPGEGCSVRYDLLLRQGSNGATTRALVNGRLFGELGAAEAYGERVTLLAERVRAREEVEPFTSPACVLDPLPLAVSAFPIDTELPTLVEATDCRHMLEVMRETLSGSLRPDACHVGVAHYPRRSRCVLRYEVEGRRSQEARRRAVYGKIGTDGWTHVDAVLAALRKRPLADARSHRFRTPCVLAVRPELKLALLQPVGGVLSIPRLLVAHASGASGGVARAELEKAVELSARIAATLHELDAEIPATTTLDGELTTLAASLSIMQRLSPALAGAVEELLARLQARAAASAALPPVLCHGDYTPSQVVFDGAGSGVVDFDGVCFGEPALDLGQFCAHLRVACRKTARGRAQSRALEDRLCERFLTAYTRAAAIRPDDVAQLRERVAVYELVSLLGMGVRSWQQLKPQRTALVLAQLAERTAAPASPRE